MQMFRTCIESTYFEQHLGKFLRENINADGNYKGFCNTLLWIFREETNVVIVESEDFLKYRFG